MSAKAASKVVKQLAGSGTGQSLMDRVTQAKYSLAGSGLGKVVAKATTEEIGAPKKKHIDYLVNCSNEPNVSIPLLAGLLVERTQEKSWVIVFKALITTHNLMNFGNEKFSHYLASNNCPVDLPHFNDKTSSQSYEMSIFIRKYSKYLSEKIASYRAMAFDFCKVKRGRDDGVLRTMPVDKLLKGLPVMQSQILTLLEFDAMEKDLNNAIINAAFLLLYKDLIRLFASYNEGMINLIEKYFSLKRRQCRLGMDLYHAFPGLLSKLTEFLTLAESLGIGDKDSLGLQPVPEKVIQAMEQHLQILESKKGSDEEGEDSSNARASTKPGVPKKPTLVVPIPNQTANPTETNKSATRTHTDDMSNANWVDKPNGSTNVEGVSEQLNDSTDSTSSHPAVTVNDEDGLPSALQEEIIATARGHLNETLVKSTEAVKRSTQHGAVNIPVHTQLGRSEHRTVSVPPTRSRSPSPARPPPASPSHNVVTTPKQPSISVSDSEAIEDDNEEQLKINRTKHNLSLLGLNQEANAQTGASSVCASPFAGDEEPVAPVTDTTTSWSDKPPAHMEPVHGTGVSSTKPSAIDDLLGLDLLSTDPIPQTDIKPIPISVHQIASTGDDNAKTSVVSIDTTAASATSHVAVFDDLLSLDPLLEKDSNSDGAAANTYQPPTNPPGLFNNSLPAGLKPVPSTVPIRPAVVLSASQNKNPLDALDSTLSNLASSLGGQQAWGSTNMKKKPLAESEKPT
ncbi:Phosphatidylinositol-binding clathrin assembly protein unc-11 [Schistosoma japonicum]|nr:Phosphatidylinositol-binding clathrin assembly protein unc-11 [Schistosoma japonicum]